MEYETRQAYSEICAVLSYMPNEYVEKIPQKIIKLFQTKKLENYEPNINKSNPLDKNYLNHKTMVLLAMLNYQYWCPNVSVKNQLYKQYFQNNEKYKAKIEKQYSIDNLFKNNKKEINDIKTPDLEYTEENVSLIEYQENKWYKKIFNALKRIFNRKS